MTTEELCAEIERLDAAATAGPWYGGHFANIEHPCDCRYVLADNFMGSVAVVSVDNGIEKVGDGWNDSPPVEEARANFQLIASYRTLAVEAAKKLREMQAASDFYKNACIQQSFEVQQILGKALGYPTMDTCPEIGGLPSDTDIVFVGIHTAESIADEAATVILRGAQQ